MTRTAGRAVVATAYGGPEVLAVVPVEGVAPGPGEVVVEVRAAGVNPADWKVYTGAWGTDTEPPLRLGFEAAGVIAAVGEGVPLDQGQEVVVHPATGAYTDLLLARATAVHPAPAGRDWAQAAGLLVTGTTAWHAVEAVGVREGDVLLVHGASGGVGAAVVQLARLRGARVVGTAGPRTLERVAALGAEAVPYGDGLADRLRGAGVTAVVDAAGTAEAVADSLALVADRDRIATVAGHAHAAGTGIRLLGAGAGSDPGTAIRKAARPELVRLWAAGELTVPVAATWPLDQAADAHRAQQAREVSGKVVLLT